MINKFREWLKSFKEWYQLKKAEVVNHWLDFKDWYRLKRKKKADWYEMFPTTDDFRERVVNDIKSDALHQLRQERYLEMIEKFSKQKNGSGKRFQ